MPGFIAIYQEIRQTRFINVSVYKYTNITYDCVGSRPSVCQSVCKQKKKGKKRCLSVGSELLNLRGTQLFPAKRTKKKKKERSLLFPFRLHIEIREKSENS